MANGNIIFFGTSQICIPFLDKLIDDFEIKLIITQPDSFGGRHKKKIISPVKSFALEKNIKLEQPENLKNKKITEAIEKIGPDIGIVISYGKFIPETIFRIPRFKTINVHFSLLPLYRGAAPVQRAIENGEKKTGITIFEIDKKMDTGDIWSQKEYKISELDTSESLLQTLSINGSSFLIETLEKIFKGDINKYPQDNKKATYAKTIEKKEGKIDWNLSAHQICNKFRAFYPWPGIFFFIDNKLIKIKKLAPLNTNHDKKPGTILNIDKNSIAICCGCNSVLEILEIQPEGKTPMTPYHFSLGNKLPKNLN